MGPSLQTASRRRIGELLRFSHMRRWAIASLLYCGFAVLMIGGCQKPLTSRSRGGEPIRVAVEQAISRELHAVPAGGQAVPSLETTTSFDEVTRELAPRRAELDALGPLARDVPANQVPLGPGLDGAEPTRVGITLATTLDAAVNRNYGLQISQLQPQITAEDLIAAEAAFDAVLFSNVDLLWTDEPQRVPVLMGFPLGRPFNKSRNYRFETGVRKRSTTGAETFISTDLNRFENRTPGITFFPDPAYTGAVRFGASQPLLRGFGRDVNEAPIDLATNQRRRTERQFEADLLQLSEQTENAYWDLDAAWRELIIAEWLVEEGVDVRNKMEARRDVDTRLAQYSDAVARVEQRRADVIRARRQVRATSDALKSLINDPTLPVATEDVLHPLDVPAESPAAFNLRETILAAIERRPELHQAALDIDDASIRQRVANNERLPLLNLSGQAIFFGLDDNIEGAYREANDGSFIDYVLGLAFEWPLGNRAAEAGARAARLRRSAATLHYQRTLQSVILDVKNALREVMTNYELILATRSFRVAQAENLRTLLVEEEFLAGLTPEFLNLKFTRQETLAQARRQEVQAVANFNKSLAALRRAMGSPINAPRSPPAP